MATIFGCGQDVADASPEWRTCTTGTNAIGTNGRTAEARDAHADTIATKHGGRILHKGSEGHTAWLSSNITCSSASSTEDRATGEASGEGASSDTCR